MNADRVAAELGARSHGAIARRDLLDRGVTRDEMDGRLARGLWKRRYPGIYLLPGAERSLLQELSAACLVVGEGAVISHRAAGHLLFGNSIEPRVEMIVPREYTGRVRGAVLHRPRALQKIDVCRIDDLPVTTPPRTLIDLATVLEPGAYEEVLDLALSRGITTLARVERSLDRLGRQGRKRARMVHDLIDARKGEVRPPTSFERRLVRLLIAHGLPEPVTQFEVLLPSGKSRFLDAAYPDQKVGAEADTYGYHSSRSAWARDHTRNRELAALGWLVLPVVPADLDDRPLLIVGQIACALASRSETPTSAL